MPEMPVTDAHGRSLNFARRAGAAYRWSAAVSALLVATALAAPAARAQQTSPPPGAVPSAQELDPARLAAQRKAARARPDDLFSRPSAGACPLRDSPLTFTLRSVTFDGATTLSPADMAGLYSGQVGQTVRVGVICDIRDRAAALLFSRGILARVEIPEQRIAGGEVRLSVIEARIASVHVSGDAGPAQAQVEAYLERLRGMAPFDLNQAQRYLLLAADIPGVRITSALRPSADGRGAVDLEVTVSRDPIDVLFNAQDFGSKAIGRGGALVRADFNGFTPWGERTSIVIYSTFDKKEQQLVQLSEEGRIGDRGLLARGSLAYAVSHPGDTLKPLDLKGESVVGALELAYPIIRKRRSSLNVAGGIDYVDQQTDFGGGGLLVDDHLRIGYARIEAGARQVLRLPVEVSGGLEVRRGLNILGASSEGETALSRSEGDPEAWVYRADLQLDVQPLSWIGAHVAAQGQYSDKVLLSYEQLSLGNLTIGRGYDPSSASGDRGVAVSAELRVGPFSPFSWLQVSTYGFYDAGYLEDLTVGGDNRTITSAGGGFRFRFANRVNLDVAYAKPFDKPFEAAIHRPPARLLLNLTVALY
jgi:hemolysin activation/secretion protein